jgi:predicted nuclease of predicted toxin-antitoxin system
VKKLLLDECIPRKFKSHLSGYDCLTVPEAGWAGKTNGELLSLAENAGFQVFVSLDQGIEFQQNLTGRNIAVILLRAKSNRLADLIPLAEKILMSLPSIGPGLLVWVQ